ncbi:MAG: hypothetical protein AAF601_14395 [Pseudomonadota bacterium]
MTYQNMQAGERFVASSHRLFASHDIVMRVGYDFEQYRALLRDSRPDHTVGVPFNPDLHDFSDGSAFWIVGLDGAGKVMHSQALRLLDLTGTTLAGYLKANFTDFPPPSMPLDLDRCSYQVGPGAARMTGRMAYHGEFWISDDTDAYRGSGLSAVMARYGFWMATQHWDPDHIFAFILNQVHYKGLAARTGWMHTDPAALVWTPRDGRPPFETVMAYLHRDDVDYLLSLPVEFHRPARPQAA